MQRFQKRYDELSKLIRGLYENLVSGLLPERQYKQLMKQYDDEQAELETKIEEMQKELTEEKANTVDIKHFISLIRKCKEPTEISDLMFAELIDKIVVYEAEGVGKARTQKVDIYFNYVGQVDIAYTEEELAEIKEQEEQELVVYTYDNTGAEGQAKGKQALNKWGCWYTPVSGIWQTVWLEPVNSVYIEDLMIRPDVDNSCLKMRVNTNEIFGVTVNISLLDKEGNKIATLENGKVERLLTIPIDNPHLWSVEDPYLYDLDIAILKDGVQTDAVSSYLYLIHPDAPEYL